MAAVVVMCACVGVERNTATKKEKDGQQHFLSIAPLTLPDPAPDEAIGQARLVAPTVYDSPGKVCLCENEKNEWHEEQCLLPDPPALLCPREGERERTSEILCVGRFIAIVGACC